MKKTIVKQLSINALIFAISLTTTANAQKQKNNRKPGANSASTARSNGSRTADSYDAVDYYSYYKGSNEGRRGTLHAEASAIALKSLSDSWPIRFAINNTAAFQIIKGTGGEPIFFGEGNSNKFIGFGSLTFFGGNKGKGNNTDIPGLLVNYTSGMQRVGVNTSSPAYRFEVVEASDAWGNVLTRPNYAKIGFKNSGSIGGVGTINSYPLGFYVNNIQVGTFLNNGNFGIGNTSPVQKLHVDGNTYLNGNVGIGVSAPTQKLQVQGNALINGAVGINNDMTGISQSNLNKYSMFVNKGILSEEYALGPRSSWADFVFSTSYRLPRLDVVEQFIISNHRLPEMPSAEEVNNTGYSLHDMNVKLLQKVEELTLYMIEQQKQIEQLKSDLMQQKALIQQNEVTKRQTNRKKSNIVRD
ncbi:hypothetical protein ACFQ3S_14305 [Mucilaginibacter terrae]|uniref:hypothetical protein n=1 Tax=Mucilaginibacter terrae TaxID=1955052 RepID=UPI003624E016